MTRALPSPEAELPFQREAVALEHVGQLATPVGDEWKINPEAMDRCGVFMAYDPTHNAGRLACEGIIQLKNRGKESTGVAIQHGNDIVLVKGMGTGLKVFPDRGEQLNVQYPASEAIAQARWGTMGSHEITGAQPMVFETHVGERVFKFSLGTNGQLKNCDELASMFGIAPGSWATDSELKGLVIADVIRRELEANPDVEVDFAATLKHTLPLFDGAFTTVFMANGKLYAARDAHGMRPAELGAMRGGGYAVASEVTALDAIDAMRVGEVGPGMMVVIEDGSIRLEQWIDEKIKPEKKAGCVLEAAYILKLAGSKGTKAEFHGIKIEDARFAMGKELADVNPVEADLICGMPNSAITHGRGYAEGTRGTVYEAPYRQVVIAKNEDRSYIDPTEEGRIQVVRDKIEVAQDLTDLSVVIVDDSMIEGVTMREVIKMMRNRGALEVHVRIALAAFKNICIYGVNAGDKNKLIASYMTLDEIADYIDADSVAYLPVSKLKTALGEKSDNLCDACLTGNYPAELPRQEVPVTIGRKVLTMA